MPIPRLQAPRIFVSAVARRPGMLGPVNANPGHPKLMRTALLLQPALRMIFLLLPLGWVGGARAADPLLRVDLGQGAQMELVWVPPGRFLQGSPAGEPGRHDDEARREVTLTQGFYLGKFPVTCWQYDRFATETHFRTEAERGPSGGFGWDGQALTQGPQFNWRSPGFPQGDDSPVTVVTYADAEAFCAWLSRRSGRAFTLPTEAQWEYARRAGATNAWSNGNDPALVGAVAWCRPLAGDQTHPVDSRPPNAWGLCIGGNVFEWCRDFYGPYGPAPAIDPVRLSPPPDDSDPPRRVLRGGSWNREAAFTRAAARYRNTPASRNADNGFRVLAPPPAAPQRLPPPHPTP